MKETLATGVVNCPSCRSTNLNINLCAYLTLRINDNLEVDYENLTIKSSDDGLHRNLIECRDCGWEKQLN